MAYPALGELMIVYIPIIAIVGSLLAFASLRGFRSLNRRQAKQEKAEERRRETASLARSADVVFIDLYASLVAPGASCSRDGNELAWHQPSDRPGMDWHATLSCNVDGKNTDLLRVTRGGTDGAGFIARIVPNRPMDLEMTDGTRIPDEVLPSATLNAVRLHRRLLELKPRTEEAFRMRVRDQLRRTAATLAKAFLRQPSTSAYRDRSRQPRSLQVRLIDEAFGFWDARIDIHDCGRTDVSLEHAETGIAMTAQFFLGRLELFKPGGRIGDKEYGALPHPEDADELAELFRRLHAHLWPGPIPAPSLRA